jgi:hypothetical protein
VGQTTSCSELLVILLLTLETSSLHQGMSSIYLQPMVARLVYSVPFHLPSFLDSLPVETVPEKKLSTQNSM